MRPITKQPNRTFFALTAILFSVACVQDATVATPANHDEAAGGSSSTTDQGGQDSAPGTGGVPNYYETLPDFANLEWVENWHYEAEIFGKHGSEFKAGAIRGAVEVLEYAGTTYLYVHDLGGVRAYTSDDGIYWDNAGGDGVHVPIVSPEGSDHSHPYGATAPDGTLQMFMQTRPVSDEPGNLFHISRASSTDGMAFSEPESFLDCQEVLAEYGCDSCAHGRVTELPDGGYAIAFSTSCQVERYPKELSKTFVPGTMMAYSDDLVNWEIDPYTYFPACHDPTFDTSQESVYMYCASEVDLLPGEANFDGKSAQVLRYDSPDGRSWTPSEPAGMVRFYDGDGVEMPRADWHMADVDTHHFADGTVRLYVPLNNDDKPTVYAFQRQSD